MGLAACTGRTPGTEPPSSVTDAPETAAPASGDEQRDSARPQADRGSEVTANADAPATEPAEPEPAPPRDPYTRLGADERTRLLAGDADTLSKTPIHYVKSNEIRHDVWFPYIAELGGAYVGVGSDQNYTVIAKARSELVFLLDIDQMVVNLHRIYEVLIKASDDPQTLLDRWLEDNRAATVALLEEAFAGLPEPERVALVRTYKASRETVYRHLRIVIRRTRGGKPTSWLSNPEMYAHIRRLYDAGRVRIMGGDLTGPNSLISVGHAARALDVPIRVVYLSNAEEYFKYTSQFRANIDGLDGDAQSVVLRTIYSKKWVHADMLWAYQVERLGDFQNRLEDPKYRSRNTLFIYSEREGVLDKDTGVKGLSLLGADLVRPDELVDQAPAQAPEAAAKS